MPITVLLLPGLVMIWESLKGVYCWCRSISFKNSQFRPWNLGRLYRRPLFKHIFITLEEGSVCKNSFKNAVLPILQCIILLDSLDFYLPRSKYLRDWGNLVNLELSERGGGNSMAVAGLRWPQERKAHEIWPASRLSSGLPLPQTKQFKIFSWPPLARCLPFQMPRLVISAPSSSTGPNLPRMFSLLPWIFPRPVLQKMICLWLCSTFEPGPSRAWLFKASELSL